MQGKNWIAKPKRRWARQQNLRDYQYSSEDQYNDMVTAEMRLVYRRDET